MTGYFYTDADGNELGPYSEQQLQELAVQSVICPHTLLVTVAGSQKVAGQISGLFTNNRHSCEGRNPEGCVYDFPERLNT